MGIDDNKTFSLNISGRQLIGIAVAFALCAITIYANALTIGYIVLTLVLCAFFIIVGFDYGVGTGPPPVEPEAPAAEPSAPGAAPRTRSGRSARTA
jgi:hypothetical protein